MKLPVKLGSRIARNYLYAFFKDFAFFSAVLVPFFTDWGGLSLFHVQLIQSWFSFWVFILEVPTGAISDKLGRKHSIALGSMIIAAAVIIYGSNASFTIFLLAEFMFAVGYALTSGADQALLYDTLKEEKREDESTKIFGRVDAIHLLGMLVAAPVGSVIAAKYGLNAPMYMSSIPFFIASLIGWSIPEPRIHSGESESPKYLEIVKSGFRSIKANPVIRTLAIDSVLVSMTAYFVIWFYQPILITLSVPIIYFGLVHSLILFSEILVSSNFGLLEKILGKNKKYLSNSAILVSLSFIIVSVFPNIYTFAAFIILGAGIGYTRATYIVSIANKYIKSRERATILSVIGMLRRSALILLNPLVGFIATKNLFYAIFSLETIIAS